MQLLAVHYIQMGALQLWTFVFKKPADYDFKGLQDMCYGLVSHTFGFITIHLDAGSWLAPFYPSMRDSFFSSLLIRLGPDLCKRGLSYLFIQFFDFCQ